MRRTTQLNHHARARRAMAAGVTIGVPLALLLMAGSATAQTESADLKVAEQNAGSLAYQTIYLTNLTQQSDANDLTTDLRNILPKSRLYYVASQGAISMRGTPEDIQLAQKILSDLDRTKKVYRLTYTITESDGGKPTGTQHYTVVVASGGKTELKEGSRVPVSTGASKSEGAGHDSEVQYVDVGLSISAQLDGYVDGMRLRSKVEQSSVAEERSGMGTQDPVIHQSTLEGTSTLVQGKPLVLGSVDIPGSTRHQEIEVVSELVR